MSLSDHVTGSSLSPLLCITWMSKVCVQAGVQAPHNTYNMHCNTATACMVPMARCKLPCPSTSVHARPAACRRLTTVVYFSQQHVSRQRRDTDQQERAQRAHEQELVLRPVTSPKQKRRQQRLQWKLMAPTREVREISKDGRVPAGAVWTQELQPFKVSKVAAPAHACLLARGPVHVIGN